MQPIEIIVIIASVGIVLGVLIYSFIRKKQGKTSCGCDCCNGNCKNCKQAQIAKKIVNKQTDKQI